MPQLEVSTYVSQIFWLIVCFGTALLPLEQESAAAGSPRSWRRAPIACAPIWTKLSA